MVIQQATKGRITLKGSTEIVSEFFIYSVNNILYQRGIYGPEQFKQIKKYGLAILVTTDPGLSSYLQSVTQQLSSWLIKGELQKLVLAITGLDSGEVLERWQFDIETDMGAVHDNKPRDKPEKEIMSEIQAIIRQITASVTFLPLLEEPCSFDVLVYTKNDISVPKNWEESEPKFIPNSQQVRLRSFNTQIHKVDTLVAFKTDE